MVPKLLEKALACETLSVDEASSLLHEVASGSFSSNHIAVFLTVFKLRLPSIDELLGFRKAMLELAIPVDLTPYNVIDLCGTGGDGKGSFNISTSASFVVAGAGVPVAKHGNYSASSTSGSSNLLEYLKVPFATSEALARQMIEEAGIAFLHAPHWHPAMKHVAPVRKELGFRTVFNLLGPLVNPSQPKHQLVGVSSQEIFELYETLFEKIAAKDATSYCIVHSLDGYDEISLTGEAVLAMHAGRSKVSPQAFGFSNVDPETLKSPDVTTSASILIAILEDHDFCRAEFHASRQVVLANASLALKVAKPQKSLFECVELASESIKSGRALQSLRTLQGAV